MAITKVSNSGFKSGMTKYDSFLAGNPYYVPPAFESIQTVAVGAGGTSSITFNSIPNTYTHLQIRGFVQGTTSGTDVEIDYRINSDSTASYTYHHIQSNGGSSAYAIGYGAGTNGSFQRATASSATNNFGTFVLDILDYANTSKKKTIRSLGGYDNNGSGSIFLVSNVWLSTSAVNSINIYPNTGNWAQYSHFALYGVRS